MNPVTSLLQRPVFNFGEGIVLTQATKTWSENIEQYDLVAPCGDYCGGCGQYNGLISETAKQMRKFADLYAFEFRSEGAFDFKQLVRGLEWFTENAKCPGCGLTKLRTSNPHPSIRPIGLLRMLASVRHVPDQYSICFECEEFPCSKFKDYADPDMMDRYERFKEMGFERWVKEQVQKANEGYEIHLQKVATLRPE